ncbi:hypothetical protein WH47_09545 [Habropoda laboriosa]|uniref:Uncharacterized protein n=1 Tax=Habropoda laboriosa TaxID=597456 RepID=A0A0L7RDQ5_9HYME|nr:hypothetical protein WH47_09545 [Habropoda laboriosa]
MYIVIRSEMRDTDPMEFSSLLATSYVRVQRKKRCWIKENKKLHCTRWSYVVFFHIVTITKLE